MQKFYPFDFELNLKDITLREGTGISNLDGRLWGEMGKEVAGFFGDEALVRARVGIEARYLIALSGTGVIRKLSPREKKILLNLHTKIDAKVYRKLRVIEAQTRHDVITMTLIMKSLLKNSKSLQDIVDHGWVHWGLSSEDVDNLARSILTANFIDRIYIPQLKNVIKVVAALSEKTKKVVIPGKTHLQTAVPTTFGKEIAVTGIKLAQSLIKLKSHKLKGKLTGAVGNLSAHKLAYPEIDWIKVSRDFVFNLGLAPNPFTTQVEPKISFVELFQILENVNSVVIDLSQDMRIYAGFDWISQEVRVAEFGSSAMPQKVNPIDFENAAGNAMLSNWILEGLIRQMPISWLQRDLVDKTILRNLGLPFGYSQIALISSVKGLTRISPNYEKISFDLTSDWSALAEAYQIILRKYGKGEAYDELKNLSRGKKLTKEDIDSWISGLNVPAKVRKELGAITFKKYTGYATQNCVSMIRLMQSAVNKY